MQSEAKNVDHIRSHTYIIITVKFITYMITIQLGQQAGYCTPRGSAHRGTTSLEVPGCPSREMVLALTNAKS